MAEGSVLLAVVALRKESVDRNTSPKSVIYLLDVALRKESVDRNRGDHGHISGDERRSPQGERG